MSNRFHKINSGCLNLCSLPLLKKIMLFVLQHRWLVEVSVSNRNVVVYRLYQCLCDMWKTVISEQVRFEVVERAWFLTDWRIILFRTNVSRDDYSKFFAVQRTRKFMEYVGLLKGKKNNTTFDNVWYQVMSIGRIKTFIYIFYWLFNILSGL